MTTVQTLMNRLDEQGDTAEVGAIYSASRRVRIIETEEGVLTAFIDNAAAYSTYANSKGLRGYGPTGEYVGFEDGSAVYLSEWKKIVCRERTFTSDTLRGWTVAVMRDLPLDIEAEGAETCWGRDSHSHLLTTELSAALAAAEEQGYYAGQDDMLAAIALDTREAARTVQ